MTESQAQSAGSAAVIIGIAALAVICFVYIARNITSANAQARITPVPLLSQDGCTVYKFYDERHWRYFTTCSKPNTAASVGTI